MDMQRTVYHFPNDHDIQEGVLNVIFVSFIYSHFDCFIQLCIQMPLIRPHECE